MPIAVPNVPIQPYPRPKRAAAIPEREWLRIALNRATAAGRAASARLPRRAYRNDVARAAAQLIPARPRTATDRRELRIMHAFAAARTPAIVAQAQWLAHDGDKLVWEAELREWQQTVTPAEAAWGAMLLEKAILTNNVVSDLAKRRFKRRRPFAADPSLKTVVPRSTALSASYPSGHTSRAFAEATVMGFLNPARRGAYLQLARQMALARITGGVHYPSDTVTGAFEGAMVGAWVVANTPPPQS